MGSVLDVNGNFNAFCNIFIYGTIYKVDCWNSVGILKIEFKNGDDLDVAKPRKNSTNTALLLSNTSTAAKLHKNSTKVNKFSDN